MKSSPSRVPTPAAAEVVDRSRTLSFRFDGRSVSAHPGDTIASALAAAGVNIISRSFKYHRPRGLLCCAGHCPNCLVQVGDEPNVRACQRPAEHGMNVSSQNAWPSRRLDLLSLAGKASRFMPVGFYYKTFMRPPSLWPLYEGVLRRAAGLGTVDEHCGHDDGGDKQYLHGDVAVVGGGPAGIGAALAAAQAGARTLLFDENPTLGGHRRYSRGGVGGSRPLESQIASLSDMEEIQLFTDTAVVGLYEGNWLAAVRDNRLFKVRAKAVVVATGANEVPLVFDENDLPGVMLAGAVQRLVHLYGVAPGRRAVVVTANDDGWQVAADLIAAGVRVEAVADERGADAVGAPGTDLANEGVKCLFGHTIRAARGPGRVRGAVLTPVPDADGNISPSPLMRIDCDLIAISVGWAPLLDLAYMAGGRGSFDDGSGEARLESHPAGIFTAGRCTGTHDPGRGLEEGELAGEAAAAYGLAWPGESEPRQHRTQTSSPVRRTSTRVRVPGTGKQFVCLCEDVTDVDIETAMAEGYDSIELLKRYSTITMGPCQGRMCSTNSIHLCARGNDTTVQTIGKTTSRPPVSPVSLGALAGQKMEPEQVSPLHAWHLAQGASMMVAGLWLRPEHYGNATAEVKAVREGVGVIDVSPLGKFHLSGPGVPDLLERMYVNHWRRLRRGRVRYGIMCNDEGVVLDDGVCARTGEESWYMSTTSTGASGIGQWLEWWMQSGWGDGVHLLDLTETNAAFNLAGPRSRQVLQELTDRDVSNEKFPYMRVRNADVAGVPCRILRLGFTGELSYEIHCPAGYGLNLWEELMRAGEGLGIRPFGVEAQRVLRLEKAHIIVGQDTDVLSDAIAANAAWAVKLDKPDFLGKRELLRISKAGPSQRLVGFRMVNPEHTPEEGMQIVQADRSNARSIIGWVTSSRFSPTLNESIGLCWLPATIASQQSASLYIYMDGRLEEARVHHGAFFDPEGARVQM